MRLPINVFAMTNRQHCDESARVVNFVDDSVGSRANAPRAAPLLQFLASGRSGILSEENQMAFEIATCSF
jgi:hypothetical protein